MLEFWQKHFQMCCRTELLYFYHRSHFQRAVASFSVDVRSCFCWFFHVVTVTDVQQLRHLQRVRSRSADRLSRDFSAGRRSPRFGWASSLLSHVPGAQRRSRWLMQTLIKKCCHLAFLFVAFFFFLLHTSSDLWWSVDTHPASLQVSLNPLEMSIKVSSSSESECVVLMTKISSGKKLFRFPDSEMCGLEHLAGCYLSDGLVWI